MKPPIIGITSGDPCGIGPEIIVKSLNALTGKSSEIPVEHRFSPIIFGDFPVIKKAKDLYAPGLNIRKIEAHLDLEDVNSLPLKDCIYVFDTDTIKSFNELESGKITAAGGGSAVESIRRAVDLFDKGLVQAIATAPINKEALRAAGYTYTGHTEMLAEMTGSRRSLTLFTVDKLRTYFHSRHLSLKDAINSLTTENVIESIRLTGKCLESLGMTDYKIALAALNPHASDGGLFGDEEKEILRPAVEAAIREGIRVEGPIPADSVFNLGLEGVYDAVISLYHDQGHIATKTYDFYKTVSLTLGLPFIRTSVDHGTAFNIAWKGMANPTSMTEAVLAASKLAGRYNPGVFDNSSR
jgi:4-phospho-D-threonate 3-dehydrogenase / 4-phospho-D-erythronate 3-dehydrogenase